MYEIWHSSVKERCHTKGSDLIIKHIAIKGIPEIGIIRCAINVQASQCTVIIRRHGDGSFVLSHLCDPFDNRLADACQSGQLPDGDPRPQCLP